MVPHTPMMIVEIRVEPTPIIKSLICPLLISFFCQFLIHSHQLGHTGGLSGSLDVEAVGAHDRLVVLLVGLAQFGGHGGFIVEVSQAGVGIQGPGIQNGLGSLLNFDFLLLGRGWPREVIVDDCVGISVITF